MARNQLKFKQLPEWWPKHPPPPTRNVFIERRISPTTGRIELWEAEWENLAGMQAKKTYLKKIGDEQPIMADADTSNLPVKAICWSYGRTLGNIAMFSDTLVGSFTGPEGHDAVLVCDFVHAGKFRHGEERWWCRTHQTHWGLKADLLSYKKSGVMCCANRSQLMHYVRTPFEVNVHEIGEVGVWCSLPPAISTNPITPRPPRIHVHVRREPGGPKVVDQDFKAITLRYTADLGLFASKKITQVSVTPPAAFEYLSGVVENRPMDCVSCSHCGVPHLDLGDFARKPHRKHFCGNCGRDSTWSRTEICSTPLKPLHDQMTLNRDLTTPDRTLVLDEYADCQYVIWASTPAILWTGNRPQEQGIHVHVVQDGTRIIDDTYQTVILNGKPLDREQLLAAMMARTVH